MGDWQHPPHYTEQAKAYAVATRAAEIAVFVRTSLPALVEAARVHGYALAVHGSQQRDLDLVAAPWTDDASPAGPLLTALCEATARATGWGQPANRGSCDQKPHGRFAMTIVASFQIELDVSVMPLLPTKARSEGDL